MALSRTVKHLRLLVILTISLEAVGILLHFNQLGLLDLVIEGNFVSTEQINKFSRWGNYQFIFHLALYSFSALFFLRWAYVSDNKSKQTGTNQSKSLSSFLLLWLVPLANLVKPLQHILGFSLNQYKERDRKSLDSYQRLIIIWWVLWLISGPLGRVLIYVFYPDLSVVESYSYMLLYIAIEFISVITGILFITILSRQLQFIRANK